MQNILIFRRRLRAGKEVDSADQKKIKRGRKRKQSKSNDEDVEEGKLLFFGTKKNRDNKYFLNLSSRSSLKKEESRRQWNKQKSCKIYSKLKFWFTSQVTCWC